MQVPRSANRLAPTLRELLGQARASAGVASLLRDLELNAESRSCWSTRRNDVCAGYAGGHPRWPKVAGRQGRSASVRPRRGPSERARFRRPKRAPRHRRGAPTTSVVGSGAARALWRRRAPSEGSARPLKRRGLTPEPCVSNSVSPILWARTRGMESCKPPMSSASTRLVPPRVS